jgi:TonB family protein
VAPKLSFADRIKALVKKEPPPPPPPPKVIEPPKQLADAPKPIELKAQLNIPKPLEAKLQTKEGFKTTADAKLIEKTISLKTPVAAIAPLSAKKLGTIENRDSLKSDKGNFKIAQTESLQSIGGGPSIADPTAPRIAIQTGKTGSKEGFTAPPPQKLDKGKIGNIAGASLGDDKALGLRDRIIARDAAVGQINNAGASRTSLPAGGGAVATKQDAGRFEGGKEGGVLGGVPGGTGTGLAGAGSGQRISAGTVAAPKKKKEMFQLTGELKDRARTHQEVPLYPAWAEQKGIEAAVVLQFSVEPEGIVKDAIVVVRTSGYPELDELAKKALRKWKFVALPDGENRVEVGTITFNYTLN